MTGDESKKLAAHMAKLFFGKMTPEQGAWVAKQFVPFDARAARAAVEAHRALHDRPNFPALMEGLRAAERKAKAESTHAPEQSWFDVQRRLSTSPSTKQASDVEVALRHHRTLWHDKRCPGHDGARRQIHSGCVAMLWVALAPPEDIPQDQIKALGERVEALAATIFDLDPDYFRRVLDDVRASVPAGVEVDVF